MNRAAASTQPFGVHLEDLTMADQGKTPREQASAQEAEEKRIEQEANTDRAHSSKEGSLDRRATLFATGVSGVLILSGTLGSQLISNRNSEPTKAYAIELSGTPFDCDSRNTVLKLDSQTGDTWYARKRSDGVFEWVKIVNDAQPSIPTSTEPCVPLASPSPTKSTR
jgi:hypothetical protein